ncbi:glycosyltransferase family 2 protein [Aerococcus tenax]|uniref:glycosyltransferase family 2 protein n=1 Tax=Aerococcus tenax TaxID=3078812 RepID=UPI0018A6FB8D|nr:glycosyltransferase family 2 protein [Aerococcus tenax]
MRNKVSIIIPIYNSQDYLEQALLSVKNQTHTDIEVLMVDDGSTDNSSKICQKFANEDARFLYIKQKNMGVSAARNRALSMVSGKYIFFLDSDDYLSQDLILKLVKAINAAGTDLAECAHVRVKEDTYIQNKKFTTDITTGNLKCLENLIKENNTTHYVWGKLYKADLLKKYKFIGLKYSEDFLFNIEYFKEVRSYCTISDIGYYYRINEVSVTEQWASQYNESLLDKVEAGKRALVLLKDYPSYYVDLVKFYICNSCAVITEILVKDNTLTKKSKLSLYEGITKIYKKYYDFNLFNLVKMSDSVTSKLYVYTFNFGIFPFKLLLLGHSFISKIVIKYRESSKEM